MVETAAHLTDHVLPRLPVRQWVLSIPKRLRYFMQRDEAVLSMVLRIFLRVVEQSLQAHCPSATQVDKTALHIGAVAFIHRFGSSLNGHAHFHVCVVDGVLEEVAGDETPKPHSLQIGLQEAAGRGGQVSLLCGSRPLSKAVLRFPIFAVAPRPLIRGVIYHLSTVLSCRAAYLNSFMPQEIKPCPN